MLMSPHEVHAVSRAGVRRSGDFFRAGVPSSLHTRCNREQAVTRGSGSSLAAPLAGAKRRVVPLENSFRCICNRDVDRVAADT